MVEYQTDIPASTTIAACQQNVDFTQVKTFINIFLFFSEFFCTWARQSLDGETKPGRIAEEKATTAATATATCYYIYYYFAIQTK